MKTDKKFRKNKLKRIVLVLLAIVFVFAASGYVTMCPDRSREGNYFDVDGWTLFQFNRSSQPWSRRVNIRGLVDNTLVVDGVLTIPTRIGRHDIFGFDFFFNPGFYTEKIVVPIGITIDANFWSMTQVLHITERMPHVEFLCNTFESIMVTPNSPWWRYPLVYHSRFIIIPDGSTQNFISRMESLGSNPRTINFIEKSTFLEVQNNA